MYRSIRTQLIIGFLLVMVPVTLFLVGNNLYSKNIVRDKVSQMYRNTLDLFVHQMDETMITVNEYLSKLTVLDDDVGLLTSYPLGSDRYILTKIRIQNTLNRDVDFYNLIDTIFIYNSNDLMLSTDHTGRYEDISRMFSDNIETMIRQSRTVGRDDWMLWYDKRVPGGDFLVRIDKVPTEELYVGAIIRVSDLLELLSIQWDDGDIGEGAMFGPTGARLAQEDASNRTSLSYEDVRSKGTAPYAFIADKESGRRYLMMNVTSEVSKLTTSILVPESYMLQGLPYFQKATYIVTLVLVSLLALYMLYIRQSLIKPLRHLISGMKKISLGILDVRLQTSRTLEFVFMANTFNNMAEQIRSLRIGVYEEQLKAQKTEMKQLQAQINPHFYMNSLNIIYNFATLKDTDSVKKMALHLGDYFRFIMRVDRDLITLEEELKHIRNYIEIQKFRFPDRLHYEERVDDELRSLMLPALSLQPFAENAILHGFANRRKPFSIRIEGRRTDDGEYALLTVEDDGEGFPEDVLLSLRREESLPHSDSSRLGIVNVAQRLKLRFQKASISFDNAEGGGAVVTIRLPWPLPAESAREG
ncbi:sensor histidine kinase [Cohnella xylanilytica]|uniref:Sensor histidine kinase n=1 Tax=Cohnella xylanilytica TaxID=557555 RepID=A0A841U9W1_9BACL|nr:sensor histidine kinase [Cohnella xylanilytica]MBB6694914.1 sensor histidine kinase [Cohnella xylanilytica]